MGKKKSLITGIHKTFRLGCTRRIWLTEVRIEFTDDIFLISTWNLALNVFEGSLASSALCICICECFHCAGCDPESHASGFIHYGASQAMATMNQIGQGGESASSALIIVFGYFCPGRNAMRNEPVLNFYLKLAWGSEAYWKEHVSTLMSSSHPRLNEFANSAVLFKLL